MEDTLRSPMFKVVVPVILGVALAIHTGHCELAGRSYIFLVAFLFLLKFIGLDRSWKYGWLFGLFLYSGLLVAAYSWSQILSTEEVTIELVNSEAFQGETMTLMELKDEPEDKGDNLRVKAEIIHMRDSAGQYADIRKPCLVYFRRDSTAPALRSGDLILARTRLQLIEPPANPGEFDFRRYLAAKGIHLRAFIKVGEWQIAAHRSHLLQDLAGNSRKFILSKLALAGIEGQELELLSSLILGKKDGLEQELKDSFSAAGAMHVLCVSGLHVGIIYLVLNVLLKHLGKGRASRLLKFVLVTGLIWFYALMTGLAPSVLRASLMFSLMQAGKLMRNPPPTVNSLAASALLLILLQPMVISNLGFQFSFLAVLAILHFNPMIQSLWQPAWPLLEKVWSLIAVSLAAQLGTAPIALHYFHQFPTWFLLTNLAVIPLASIIIYMTILVILLPVGFLHNLPGKGLELTVHLLELSVRKVESLPYSVITDVQLPVFQLMLIYFLLIFILLMIHFRAKVYFFIILVLACIFFIHLDLEHYYHSRLREIVVYKVPGYTAMDFFHGNTCYAYYGSNIVPSKSIDYSISPNRLENRVRQLISISAGDTTTNPSYSFYKTGKFIFFEGIRILLADRDFRNIPGSGPKVDVVLVTGEYEGDISSILEDFNAAEIIFDGSVPYWKLDTYIKECEAARIRYHAVGTKGSFVLTID